VKKRTSGAKGTLLIAFLLFAVILGGLVFRKYDTAARRAEPAPQAAPAGSAVVALFFASADRHGLVREGREVELEEGVEDGIESVVDELIGGPLGSAAATLPANARVLRVQVQGNLAQINFSHELGEALASGADAGTAVYSIVDTVAVNFPQIKAVQLLVEGTPLEKRVGTLELGKPLSPDFTLEQKVQASQPPQPVAAGKP